MSRQPPKSPTTEPAPEWDWYDNTDLKLGEVKYIADDPDEDKLKKKAKFPLGFALPPPDKKPVPRATKKSKRKKKKD